MILNDALTTVIVIASWLLALALPWQGILHTTPGKFG
jgi:hypothetical protein